MDFLAIVLDLPLAVSFDTIRAWITENGFIGGTAIVFTLLFTCGLGVPIPEDLPLIIAGAFLCTSPMRWAIVGFFCWAGIIGGDVCLYSLSRKYGLGITQRGLLKKHVTLERIKYVEGLFAKYGIAVVGVCRLFAGIRGAMVIAAGVTKYSFWKFFIADSIAAIVSGGLWMLLGWWVGSKLNDQIISEWKNYFLIGAIVLVVLIGAWFFLRRRWKKPIQAIKQEVVERIVEKVDHVAHHDHAVSRIDERESAA